MSEPWNDPTVLVVARAITARWGLWVGLMTRGGSHATLSAASGHRPDLPVCDAFMKREDALGSCGRSLAEWAAFGVPSATTCHAGLRAIVVPAHGLGPARAALYASGFLPADGPTAVPRSRAADLGLAEVAAGAGLEAIPRLHPADEEAVGALLEVAAAALVAASAPSPNEPRSRVDHSLIVGQSPQMLRLFATLERIARSESSVLIQGENGTGKELIARSVHANSRRRDRPFVTQNCSALNDNLLDSELFGHKRGAFTGAIADKRGLFERADGGTLFLDELGDMSPLMQLKLLRVLQEGTFVPVGDTVTRRVDVRVVTATNRNLAAMVRAGSFREDLFYRVNVIVLEAPPLRERSGDIERLALHFLREYGSGAGGVEKTLSAQALAVLEAYPWPGNVRELRHEIERLTVLSGDATILGPELLSARIVQAVDPELAASVRTAGASLPEAVRALELRMIREALEETGWNKTRAAARLGVSRRNLIRKVQSLELAALSDYDDGDDEDDDEGRGD